MVVEPGNTIFWKAFQMLSRMRRPPASGDGLSDILLVDIVAYADLAGITDRDLRTQLCRVIIEIDNAFLDWVKEEQQKQQKPKEPEVTP